MGSPPRVPQLPGGPDPTGPVPRDPVDGVDLPGCAAVAGSLAAGGAPRADILARFGLDEARWVQVEKTWMLRIATGLLQGDRSSVEEYDAAYAGALGPNDPDRPLDAYAGIVARLEAGEDAAAVLASEGLALGAWARLHRAWTSRLADDRALAATFREMVAAARGRRAAAQDGAPVSGGGAPSTQRSTPTRGAV